MNNTKERINFEDIYNYFNISGIHREFKGNDISLLAVFSVHEILHKFYSLINEFNKKESGRKYLNNRKNNYEKGFTYKEWYYNQIKSLEEGKIIVKPEVWDYVFKKNIFLKIRKNKLEKEAAKETLRILAFNREILNSINKIISGDFLDEINKIKEYMRKRG